MVVFFESRTIKFIFSQIIWFFLVPWKARIYSVVSIEIKNHYKLNVSHLDWNLEIIVLNFKISNEMLTFKHLLSVASKWLSQNVEYCLLFHYTAVSRHSQTHINKPGVSRISGWSCGVVSGWGREGASSTPSLATQRAIQIIDMK